MRAARGPRAGRYGRETSVVLGDQVVNDVLTDPNSDAVLGGQRKKQAARQSIDFKQLRAPFSVGGGKFHLKDAYMNGDQLGATMRGTVDFKSQTVDLGGTYVPLYGLNSALQGDSHSRPGAGRPARRGRWSASPSPSRASSMTPRCWSIRCR